MIRNHYGDTKNFTFLVKQSLVTKKWYIYNEEFDYKNLWDIAYFIVFSNKSKFIGILYSMHL